MLDQVFKDAEAKMNKAVEAVDNDLKAIRTGRASSSMVDGVKATQSSNETNRKETIKERMTDLLSHSTIMGTVNSSGSSGLGVKFKVL